MVAMNPNKYKPYAFAHASAMGVLWQKPKHRKSTGIYQAGGAFISEDDEKVIETPTPNTLANLYLWLHELAHHYLGHIQKQLPYHVEEFEATKEALETMARDGFKPTKALLVEAGWNIEQAIKRDRKTGIKIDRSAEEYASRLEQGVM